MIIDGRYELDPVHRRIGGMGRVVFGRDRRLDRRVAVKLVRSGQDEESARRFVRESRVTARLDHPGVPAIYDCGTQEDELYLVMQAVDGCPVTDLIAELGTVPVSWAAAIAAQVCSVLTAAHGHGLVHRDLKPANLMLCPNGSVKVLDFGLAAVLSRAATRLTGTGAVVGTPEYVSPEQIRTGDAGPRSDLYSLGVVLDEMLTGRNQFAGGSAMESWRNHTGRPPQAVRVSRPEVPEPLERLILRLLAKSPEDRPPSAVAVYDELLPLCGGRPPLPGFVDPVHPARMYAAIG